MPKILRFAQNDNMGTYNNRPDLHSSPLADLGLIKSGGIAEYDLIKAIGSNGIYSFALVSDSSDTTVFFPREAGDQGPLLIVSSESELKPPPVDEPAPIEEPIPDNNPSPEIQNGIWISKEEILKLPSSGAEFESVIKSAKRVSSVPADVSDQDSNHDVFTLAAAIACVRLPEAGYCADAVAAVMSAVGTETQTLTTPRTPASNQWLPVGRNLTSYVIAADLLDLRKGKSTNGDKVHNWIASFLGRKGSAGVEFEGFTSGSNASAQVGAAYIAVAIYLKNEPAILNGWDAFRRFACDSTAPNRLAINLKTGVAGGWAHDSQLPCAINPKGATKTVPSGQPGAGTLVNIDGIIINDQVRGGDFQFEPGYTPFPWVGMEGLVPAAVMLHRHGFAAFAVADQAVLRAMEAYYRLGQTLGQSVTCTADCWWDYDRAVEIKHLVNRFYNKNYSHRKPTGAGRTVGFTGYTHP